MDKPQSPSDLAAAIVHPDRKVGVRIPTYPECVPTATTQSRSNAMLTAGTGVPSENGFGLLTRSPVYPFWFNQYQTEIWSYQTVYDTGVVIPEIPAEADMQESAGVTDMTNTYAGYYASSAGNVACVGSVAPNYCQGLTRPAAPLALYSGTDLVDIPFTFVPKGATLWVISAIVGGTVTSGNLMQGTDVNLEYMIKGAQSDDITEPGTVGNGANYFYKTFKAAVNMWVRPTSVSIAGYLLVTAGVCRAKVALVVSNASENVTFSANVGVFPGLTFTGVPVAGAPMLLPVPGTTGQGIWNFSSAAFESVMFTGVSLAMENVTKIVAREGTITAGCLTDASINVWAVASSAKATEAAIAGLPTQRSYRGGAEHGLSASVLPGKNFQRLRSHVANPAGYPTIPVPVMHVVPGDYYTIFAINDPDIGVSASAESQMNFSATVCTTWEYVADTQFVECRLAGTSIEVMHKTMLAINSNPVVRAYERGVTLAVTGPRAPRAPLVNPQKARKARMIGPMTKAQYDSQQRRKAAKDQKRKEKRGKR